MKVICDECGKTFEKNGTKAKRCKNHFCNKDCLNKYRLKNKYATVVCLQCGNEFTKRNYDIKIRKKYFCSQSCSASYNNKIRILRNKKKISEKKCLNCGKPINRNNKMYCSIKCVGIHRYDKNFLELENMDDLSSVGIISRRNYFKEKYGVKCQICERHEWEGKIIPLVLDHIDGNPYNNKKDNLRLICPNCDALLPTFTGRNRGFGRKERMKDNASM